MAKPNQMTEAARGRIVAAVRLGASREVAAKVAGVAKSTLQLWLQRGEQSGAPARYRRFARELRVAEAARELEALASIRGADNWRAAAWYLERCRGYSQRHEVKVEQEPPAQDLSRLSDEELEAWQRLAEKAEGGGDADGG